MNAQEIKAAARRFGADLVGIAPIERFAALPKEQNPLSVFPQAKSVIVVGERILRGALLNPDSFQDYGFVMLEDLFVSKLTYDLVIWIEARNFEAVPMFGYDVDYARRQEPFGIPVSPEKPAPNVWVDWKNAAVQCGLGVIGRAGFFLSPEFGPLQRCAMLVSDCELEPDELLTDFAPCNGCDACAKACPRSAISDSIDLSRCEKCSAGTVGTNFGRFHAIERGAAACGMACAAKFAKRNTK